MMALGIAVATVAAFVISSGFYAVVPATGPASDRPAPWQILVEVLRSAVTAGLVAGLLRATGHTSAIAGALLGLALWALPVVLLTGSVVWEKVPVRSAATHAGDWLVKLVAIGAIVGAFA